MMSIKQWLVILCMFLGYIVFGATVFYTIESKEEALRLAEETKQKHEIEDLIEKYYVPNEIHTKHEIFTKVSTYCNKPLGENSPHATSSLHWTFYHSMFFVLTVISTIGYGNLAPTTPFTRAFVIIYGIIGIPLNGIVVITLGDFFGRTFRKLYKRWKNLPIHRALATLGLIGQIILYSIPGFAFFILIPSLIIVLYEDWTYDLAIEFAFATLTTVGVGHLVPGTNENDRGALLYLMYKTFLLLWIITGLGYLAMVFGFISRGLRSKHVHHLEHKITRNIKKTNRKIRRELRSLLNEYLLMRVKPVYRERRINAPMACQRTQSCPDLRFDNELLSIKIKKRAISELPRPVECLLSRRQSDTDLQCIDRERTFRLEDEANEHNKLLLRVVNALSNYNTITCSSVTGSSEETDTLFDHCESQWSTDDREWCTPSGPMRPRAATESRKEKVAGNFNLPWVQRSTTRQIQETREREKYGKARSRTLPPIGQTQNLFTRLKNTFRQQTNSENQKNTVIDIESQISTDYTVREDPRTSDFSIANKDQLLEETTIADFLRALTVINFREVSRPRRKLGTADRTCVPRTRRLPITPVLPTRKISLIPSSPSYETKLRRLSLNPTKMLNNHGKEFRPLGSPLATPDTFVPRNNKISTQNRKFSFSTCRNIHRERCKSMSSHKIGENKNKKD